MVGVRPHSDDRLVDVCEVHERPRRHPADEGRGEDRAGDGDAKERAPTMRRPAPPWPRLRREDRGIRDDVDRSRCHPRYEVAGLGVADREVPDALDRGAEVRTPGRVELVVTSAVAADTVPEDGCFVGETVGERSKAEELAARFGERRSGQQRPAADDDRVELAAARPATLAVDREAPGVPDHRPRGVRRDRPARQTAAQLSPRGLVLEPVPEVVEAGGIPQREPPNHQTGSATASRRYCVADSGWNSPSP